MITPRFTLDQNDDFVVAKVVLPHIRLEDLDVYMLGQEFRLHIKPYFLSLTFDGTIVEDGRESAQYDRATDTLTVLMPKEVPGTHFSDLDMLTKLLPSKAGKGEARAGPLIEVVGETGDGEASAAGEEEIDWTEPVQFVEERVQLPGSIKYGFNRGYSGFFDALQEMVVEIVDNLRPDDVPYEARRSLRLETEDEDFSVEHYQADHMLADEHEHVRRFKPELSDDLSGDKVQETMRGLPNKEYLVWNEKVLLLGLVDILYADAYDRRTTEDDRTVESPWTVCKLSATLSWFDEFATVKDALVASMRRSLAYPLYRNFALSEQVLGDVVALFQLGRRAILRRLLDLIALLNTSDLKYYLNRLYVEDYAIWIQRVTDERIAGLAAELASVRVDKGDLNWNLAHLEAEAEAEAEAEG